MNLITLDEAKSYLRVDSGMDDELILSLLASAEKLSCDVARMNANEWKRACGEKPGTMALRGERLSHAEKDMLRSCWQNVKSGQKRWAARNLPAIASLITLTALDST